MSVKFGVTIYVCDRCGEEEEQGNDVIFSSLTSKWGRLSFGTMQDTDSNASYGVMSFGSDIVSTQAAHIDLCPSCLMTLREFLQPFLHAQKKGAEHVRAN